MTLLAQGLVSRIDLSSVLASKVVERAVLEAGRIGIKVCAVVADSSGLPLAVLRMDEVNGPILEIATDKAYTAASFRRTTEALRDRMNDDSMRLGASSRKRLMLWGGGLPIFLDNKCIGSIGVSGGTPEQDIQCASAALSEFGLRVE